MATLSVHTPSPILIAGFALLGICQPLPAQTPTPAPQLATASDPITGTWTGSVTAPQGSAEISFSFLPGQDRKLNVTVTLALMHTYGAKFGPSLEVADGGYFFPVLDTHFSLHGDQLTGTFGLGRLPLVLHRGGTPTEEPPVPAYPAAPASLWTYSLGSLTWASPVVDGDTVYVGAKDGRFHAVRARDGKGVWVWTGANRIDGRAAVADDAVCFVDGKIELVCLNRADGSLRWRFPLHDARLAGKPAPDNPTFNRRTATPLIIANTVYCGSSDGGLYAVDVATGRKIWRADAKAPVYSGISRVDDTTLAFGCMDGSIVTLNRTTGVELRRFKAGGGVVTTPLFAGSRVIAGSRDYQLYGFNIGDGTVVWKFSYWFSWIESTPVLVDGVLYIGASDYRRVSAFHPDDGRVIWSTDVRGMCWGTPAVTRDTVFIGTAAQNIPGTVIKHTGGLVALDRQTGAVKWQLLSPPAPENSFGGYAGSLALAGDRVIGAGFEGVLAAWPAR